MLRRQAVYSIHGQGFSFFPHSDVIVECLALHHPFYFYFAAPSGMRVTSMELLLAPNFPLPMDLLTGVFLPLLGSCCGSGSAAEGRGWRGC